VGQGGRRKRERERKSARAERKIHVMTRRTAFTMDRILDFRLSGFRVTSGESVLHPSTHTQTQTQTQTHTNTCISRLKHHAGDFRSGDFRSSQKTTGKSCTHTVGLLISCVYIHRPSTGRESERARDSLMKSLGSAQKWSSWRKGGAVL